MSRSRKSQIETSSDLEGATSPSEGVSEEVATSPSMGREEALEALPSPLENQTMVPGKERPIIAGKRPFLGGGFGVKTYVKDGDIDFSFVETGRFNNEINILKPYAVRVTPQGSGRYQAELFYDYAYWNHNIPISGRSLLIKYTSEEGKRKAKVLAALVVSAKVKSRKESFSDQTFMKYICLSESIDILNDKGKEYYDVPLSRLGIPSLKDLSKRK